MTNSFKISSMCFFSFEVLSVEEAGEEVYIVPVLQVRAIIQAHKKTPKPQLFPTRSPLPAKIRHMNSKSCCF
jgi:hypothetical protein